MNAVEVAATRPTGTVHFVRSRSTDPPSGGDVYNDRVCAGLRTFGWRVHDTPMDGDWPRPTEQQCARLRSALDTIPDGMSVLLDGLVACGVPEIVEAHSPRLSLTVLVHLPLACETGVDESVQQQLHRWERRALRACCGLVVPSEWTAQHLIAAHGVQADRVHIAHPGVDPAAPAPGTDGVGQLLTVAAITPMKAQDLLADALALVPDRDWHWTCVGSSRRDPSCADQVVDRVTRLGLQHRVRFSGARRGTDLAAEYAAADLLIIPSRAETYCLAVVEALARGVPVMATAVGGVPEALGCTRDGRVPGLLVPPHSPHSLATALRQWFDDADLRTRLRSAARDRRGTLNTWRDTSQRLAEALHRIRRSGR